MAPGRSRRRGVVARPPRPGPRVGQADHRVPLLPGQPDLLLGPGQLRLGLSPGSSPTGPLAARPGGQAVQLRLTRADRPALLVISCRASVSSRIRTWPTRHPIALPKLTSRHLTAGAGAELFPRPATKTFRARRHRRTRPGGPDHEIGLRRRSTRPPPSEEVDEQDQGPMDDPWGRGRGPGDTPCSHQIQDAAHHACPPPIRAPVPPGAPPAGPVGRRASPTPRGRPGV
jgi:hypothetical protein